MPHDLSCTKFPLVQTHTHTHKGIVFLAREKMATFTQAFIYNSEWLFAPLFFCLLTANDIQWQQTICGFSFGEEAKKLVYPLSLPLTCFELVCTTGADSPLWDSDLWDLSRLNDVQFAYCHGNTYTWHSKHLNTRSMHFCRVESPTYARFLCSAAIHEHADDGRPASKSSYSHSIKL